MLLIPALLHRTQVDYSSAGLYIIKKLAPYNLALSPYLVYLVSVGMLNLTF